MGHFKCQVTGIDAFPTSDLREREYFCLISFEKCGERGYFIHGEVQDEVVNVLFASNLRRRPSTTSAGSGRQRVGYFFNTRLNLKKTTIDLSIT